MKSLSTYLIAVCLFVLCLFEKEAKQQAMDAQRLKEKNTENQQVNNQKSTIPLYVNLPKKTAVPQQFQLAQFAVSDSLSISSGSSESL